MTDYGKIPPQAIDLEHAVLGSMLLDNECVHEVVGIITEDDFYSEQNRVLFQSILAITNANGRADILTVTQQLRKTGDLDNAGGVIRISELTNRIAGTANVEQYARLILQQSIRRQIIKNATEAINLAYDDTSDVFDTILRLDQISSIVGAKIASGDSHSLRQVAADLQATWKQRRDNPHHLIGVPTGLTLYDKLTGGLQPGQMVVIGARPGMGKSTLMIQCALNASMLYGKRTGIITLEMSRYELACRMISNRNGINYKRLHSSSPTNDEIEMVANHGSYLDDSIHFVDVASLNEVELRSHCRRLVRDKKCDIIWIDYIQLMKSSNPKGKNREQELSEISRTIKSTAKQLGVPIVALCQLSRAVETRGGNKRPQLSDIRESGSIEQDGDIVTFMYRPEYYGIEQGDNGESTRGVVELITAKHRGGDTIDVVVSCDLEYSRIADKSSTEPITQRLPYADNEYQPF